LAGQPGYRSKLTYADADYFNLPANDARIAKTRRATPVPTLEQITHVLATMPSTTDIELRNRALVAFAILTGARDGALASLKLKHVDLAQGHVFQDGRTVATKRGKSITTWFFPVGEQPLRIVTEWIGHLRGALLWGNGRGSTQSTGPSRCPNGSARTRESIRSLMATWLLPSWKRSLA